MSNCLLGQIALRRNQPQDAEALFETALKANSRYKEALLGVGKAKLALNQPVAALATDRGWAAHHSDHTSENLRHLPRVAHTSRFLRWVRQTSLSPSAFSRLMKNSLECHPEEP